MRKGEQVHVYLLIRLFTPVTQCRPHGLLLPPAAERYSRNHFYQFIFRFVRVQLAKKWIFINHHATDARPMQLTKNKLTARSQMSHFVEQNRD
jgi:hypothetical protein